MTESKDDQEMLSRWLDDALTEAELRALRMRLDDDPALRATAQDTRDADAAFRRHANAELSAPVSFDAVAGIKRGFADRRNSRVRQARLRQWMPLAASLLVLAGAGLWIERVMSRTSSERSLEIAQMVETAVQNALETSVSGSEVVVGRGTNDVDIRIVPIRTYRSETNHWCREFTEQVVTGDETIIRNGVACREPKGGWVRVGDSGA